MVLSTTYLDERVRLGKGSKGSLFVFTRGGAAEQAGADAAWRTGRMGARAMGAKRTGVGVTSQRGHGARLHGGAVLGCGALACPVWAAHSATAAAVSVTLSLMAKRPLARCRSPEGAHHHAESTCRLPRTLLPLLRYATTPPHTLPQAWTRSAWSAPA